MITLTSVSDAKATGHLLVMPCPFCGENPPLATMRNSYYLVGCDNDDCHVQPQAGDRNLEWAWEKWNTRSVPRRALTENEIASIPRGLR